MIYKEQDELLREIFSEPNPAKAFNLSEIQHSMLRTYKTRYMAGKLNQTGINRLLSSLGYTPRLTWGK